MVEVFKTNVTNRKQAEYLLDKIHKKHPGYTANFDLQDCDNILRIHSKNVEIEAESITSLFKHLGFTIEVLDNSLPDNKFLSELNELTSDF